MAIEFEFSVDNGLDFAQTFAERFKLPVVNHTVQLPGELGSGFIKEISLGNGIKICIHQYELKQAFVLRRRATKSQDLLTIKFDGRRILRQPNGHLNEPLFSASSVHAVEISTTNFFAEISLLPLQVVNLLIITIPRQVLLSLLRLDEEGRDLEQTLAASPSFVFHESMSSEMERILKQLRTITDSTKLTVLLYQTKMQELIYLLFDKLLSRQSDSPSVPIDEADAQKLYAVRTALLSDLSMTPQLAQLARDVGMSKTRMTQLFRQIFGDSIHNYYQAARMREAAHLLTQLSVSETGYQLGFSNLSHFTRLFERHYQLKPKRYKDSVGGTQ